MKLTNKVLAKLLTKRERKILKTRFEILRFLRSGAGVRQISREKKVSTATVVRLKKRFLPHLFQKEKSFKRTKEQKKELPWLLG